MRFTVVGLFIIMCSGTSAVAASMCRMCPAIQKLTKEFQSLDYAKIADQGRGMKKVPEAESLLEQFSQVRPSDPARLAHFDALVDLATEGSVYDIIGGDLSEEMDLILHRNPDLKSEFARINGSLSGCKSLLLRAKVESARCEREKGLIGADINSSKLEKDADSCVTKFEYEQCTKKAPSTGR